MADDAGARREPGDAGGLRVRGSVLVGPDEVRDSLRVVGGRITFDPKPPPPAGPAGGTGPAAGEDVPTLTGWVLPGLVDAHCHAGLGPGGEVSRDETEAQLLADRATGALLLRDAGSPADTRWVDDRDDLPRLIRAGRHLARTRRYVRDFAYEIEPAELPAYAAREAARGDGWVKLVGDWIDRATGDLAPCWPADAAAAAIAAAHAAGARVTAHCFAEDSLADLVAAGIDCVEHATGLTGETIEMFARRQVAIVPTLVNIATFPKIAAAGENKYPIYARHLRALYQRRYETVRAAHEAGVPIYVGTDAGGSLPHGLVAAEVAELVAAGLPQLTALSAATWAAREWLGSDGLTEGAGADFVVYPADPRADIGVLAAPTAVVRSGQVVSGKWSIRHSSAATG